MNWTRAKPRTRTRRPAERRPRRRPWRALAIALLVAGAFFGIGYAIAVFVLFPTPEAVGPGVPTPDLTGLSVEEARADLERMGLVLGGAREIATPDEPPGVIVAQSPIAGQHLLPGGAVRIGVSAEPPQRVMPDLTGMTLPSASLLLTRLGVAVDAVQESSATVPKGRVIRTSPAPGTPLGAAGRVTLFTSAGPPPALEPGGDTAAVGF